LSDLAAFDRGFERVKEQYRRILAWALHHRLATIGIAALGFFGSFALVPLIGSEFLPLSDRGQVYITFEAAPGASLKQSAELTARLEDRLRDIPEVAGIFTSIGSQQRSVNEGMVTVILKPHDQRDRHVFEIQSEMRQRLADFPGLYLALALEAGSIEQQPIGISVQGEDLRALRLLASAVEDSARSVPDAREIRNSLAGSSLRRRSSSTVSVPGIGLSMASIASTCACSSTATKSQPTRKREYDVQLRWPRGTGPASGRSPI
jgi:HAE1 family hydrophobic/amphiphilic exporter-1